MSAPPDDPGPATPLALTPTDKRPAGRPRTHDRQAIMNVICRRISDGELVQDVARSLSLHPQQITDWVEQERQSGDENGFHVAYARARQLQADAVAAQAVAAAVDTTREPNDRRVRFDGLRWLAGRLNPAKWGDKYVVEPAAPVTITVQVMLVNGQPVKF